MQETGERWRLAHRPALDGLRGVAVLLVVVSHALPGRFVAAGGVGVSVFFVLSGFLISALLFDERDRKGRVSLRGFYVRRARRLLPALAVFLVAMMLLSTLVSPAFAPGAQVAAVAVYAGNLLPMLGLHVGGLGHTWSLSVEEQFYLVFPALVFGLLGRASRRVLLGLALAGIVVSVALRLVLWHGGAGADRVYYGTDTNAAAFLAGIAVALWVRGRTPREVCRPALAIGLLGAVLLLGLTGEGFGLHVLAPVGATVLAAAVVALIAQTSQTGWLGARWLVLVGKRSYGLYLWHFPLFAVALPLTGLPAWVGIPAAGAAAWGLTLLSWRFVEKPVLLARSNRRPADSIPAATATAATLAA